MLVITCSTHRKFLVGKGENVRWTGEVELMKGWLFKYLYSGSLFRYLRNCPINLMKIRMYTNQKEQDFDAHSWIFIDSLHKTLQVTDFASMRLALAKPKAVLPNIYYVYNTVVFITFPAPTLLSQCYTL